MADASNTQLRDQVIKTLTEAQGLSDQQRDGAYVQFFKNTDRQAFKSGIDSIPGVPNSVKLQLKDLRFPAPASQVPLSSQQSMAPQGVAHPPPGAPNPKPDNSPSIWDQPILPIDKLVAGPKQDQPWYEQFGRGAVQGAAESGANLTSPKNLAIMGTMAGANMIPGVGELVDAGASLVLGEEQVREMIKSVPEIKKAYDANDWGKLGNLVGKDAASAFVSYKAGKRGVGKLRGKFGGNGASERSGGNVTPAGGGRTPPPPPGAPPTYPLIDAGKPQAQATTPQEPPNPSAPPGAPAQPDIPIVDRSGEKMPGIRGRCARTTYTGCCLQSSLRSREKGSQGAVSP